MRECGGGNIWAPVTGLCQPEKGLANKYMPMPHP